MIEPRIILAVAAAIAAAFLFEALRWAVFGRTDHTPESRPTNPNRGTPVPPAPMLTDVDLLNRQPPYVLIRAAGPHALDPSVLAAAEKVDRLQQAIAQADADHDAMGAVRLEWAAHDARLDWRAKVEAAKRRA